MTKAEAIARIKYHKIIHKMDEPRAIYISEALDMAIEALKCSETPNSSENHSAGVSKMMDGDTIYRQAAIEAMRTCYDTELKEFDNGDEYINYDQAVNELKRIPSASCAEESCNSENYFPDSTKMASGDLISRGAEQLTDTEQRIFLAAMGREEKVCKQVDEECRDCREPYEDSLVRICHEIVRKVKGALWTI